MARNENSRADRKQTARRRELAEEPVPELKPQPLTGSRASLRAAAGSMLAVAFRPIRPTWRNYIEYVDFAARNGDPAMVRYRDSYLALAPRDRRSHWPEQLCELANVTPGELVGAVCRALW